MFICIVIKIRQIFKNLFCYLSCLLTPVIIALIIFGTLIWSWIFHQYFFIIFIIFVSIILIITNYVIYPDRIENELEIFEKRLKEKFRDLVLIPIDEIVVLHQDVKKCNKSFKKKIKKQKLS